MKYILGILICLVGCSVLALESPPEKKAEAKADINVMRSGLNQFALDLYSGGIEGDDNFFCSPLSISLALSMAYAGAGGETESQMAEVLHTGLGQERYHDTFSALMKQANTAMRKSNVRLQVAKAFFGQKGYAFRETFEQILQENYRSEMRRIDYKASPAAARKEINAWVEEKTNGKIAELVPSSMVTQDTRLFLVNAIYFKADWHEKFDKKDTKPMKFWLEQNTSVEVQMMQQWEEFAYGENEQLQILEMPYANKAVSMVVILPRKCRGLAALEAELSAEKLDEWLGLLSRPGKYDVRTLIPRFSMEKELGLDQLLSDLGMPNAFDFDKSDFAGMLKPGAEPFALSIIHKAGIKLNEEGTEAWAATGVGFIEMGGAPASPPTRIFRADHQFMFFIRDRSTGLILFMGRVINPAEAEVGHEEATD